MKIALIIFIVAMLYYYFVVRKIKKLNSDHNQHRIADLLIEMVDPTPVTDQDQFDIRMHELIFILSQHSGADARKRIAHAMTLVKYKNNSPLIFENSKELSLKIVQNIGW